MAELADFEGLVMGSLPWRLFTTRVVLPLVLSVARLPAAADVLELGGGSGANAERLARRSPGWRLLTTDVDENMVRRMRERFRTSSNVAVRMQDAQHLDLPDSTFDIVISVLAWHHLEDHSAAAREVRRVLRPGGAFVLGDIFGHHVMGPVDRLLTKTRSYSWSQLIDSLHSAGFEVEPWRKLDSVAYALCATAA